LIFDIINFLTNIDKYSIYFIKWFYGLEENMSNKEILLKLIIILLIFAVGFFLRMEAIHLNGASADQKDYYKDQNGQPYMYELDSYYNYRLTKNYLDHGYLGDIKINGTEWDLHSY
jgi:dolichyl-diphosphooligosaccharide--protein glycosyltransferase